MDPSSSDKPEACGPEPDPQVTRQWTRRRLLQYGLLAAAGLAGGGAWAWRLLRESGAEVSPEIFRGQAPDPQQWRAWQARGWFKEAYHYTRVGRNTQCRLCPNHCLLEPGDRSHCRNRVNIDGTLYTLAYGDPCSFHADPVEKKPLFHFLPGTLSFSIATAGCVFRCLNCQNWEISQHQPEETKNASGPAVRAAPQQVLTLTEDQMTRLSMPPEDVVALASALHCPSISYTYSEPVAYYEYAYDTCKLARAQGIKNIMVTCGSIEQRPLRDIAQFLDAAHIDLKGFDDTVYRKLNTGKLAPILRTLTTLKDLGVWFEIINLIVPTYTDDMQAIQRMCGWLVQHLGPDYPLHFSRFFPLYRLSSLWQTPAQALLQARDIARAEGLRYVYIGNVRELPGSETQTTWCPHCRRALVERTVYEVTALHVRHGSCAYCGTPIPGVWS